MNARAEDKPRSALLGTMALAWIVFVVALTVFLVQSRHLTKPGYGHIRERSFLLGGDEPWYLLTTRSIALDLDYNLINDRAKQEFWDKDIADWSSAERLQRLGHGRTKTPEYWEERVYPIRPIGLSIVLAPAYRLGLLWVGQVRLTCVWFLCVVGALVVQQIFLMGYELTSNRTAAVAGALAGGFAMPIIVYVTQIYTELVAALLTVVACRLILTVRRPTVLRIIIAGCCVAYLPWLHEKYYPFMLLFLLLFLVAVRPRRMKLLAGFYAPVAVSLVLLALYYHSVYGVIYPVWDHPGKTMAATVGLQGGFLGLLFHRTNGLVPFWPVAGFAIAGLALMLRDGKRAAPWLIAFVALQWLVVGSFGAWTGGRCPPLRHWLPAMPLLIVGSICALARMRRRWLVGLMGAAMVLAVVIGARNVSHPRELFKEALPLTPNPGTFAVRQIEQFYGIFPNMREPTMTDHVLGVAWLVVLVAFVVVVVWLEKGGQRSRNVVKETVGFAGDEP